jgi:sulfite exporter TauE/SafE
MKHNMGTVDRVIRVVAGILLLSLIFILESNARWWGLIGLLPLVTGLAGSCPAYLPFGIDTHRVRHETPGAPHAST